MAAETNIIEFPFSQGQNEGTQRDVLPLGQFSYLQNVRFRRDRRLGKRNGYTALATTDVSSAAIGGTPTLITTFGDGYIAVDDRFYPYDTLGDAWGMPPIPVALGFKIGGRLSNRWPQFMPAPAIAPIHESSELDLYSVGGTGKNSTASMTYAGGILWMSWSYWHQVNSWVFRVVGIDPSTGKTIFQQDVQPLAGGGAVTDNQHHHLLSTGNGTVVLVYDHFTAGVKDGIRIRLMTSRTSGFGGTEYSVACTESACNIYVGSTNHILITYADGTANTIVGNWNVSTQAFTTLRTTATAGDGVPTQLSIFGISGGRTWIGYVGTLSGITRIRYYDSALTFGNQSTNLGLYFAAGTLPVPPVLFAVRPATPDIVTAVLYSATEGMVAHDFDGTSLSGNRMLHGAARPISWPFNVGNDTFMWVRHEADAQLGVATLVRIPLSSEYIGNASPYIKSFPIEATLDDEDIDPPVSIATSGPTFPTPVYTPMGYVACLTPTVETLTVPGPATYRITRPLLVPVRHASEGVNYRQPGAVSVLGKTFVPCAQPMFIDTLGAVEAGFVQGPSGVNVPVTAGGGAMTAGATYQYSCVFEYEDGNGRLERSAPALPGSIAMGANTKATIEINALELTKKPVRAKVYRTLANQSQFYLLTSVDASPGVNVHNAGDNYFTVVDTAADTVVGANEQLYTQIGQELADSQFPACQFAEVGGERLWVGGGFKDNVVQASKTFMPRMSVAFADDDAFRVMLPEACTGIAWLDNLVAFTEEGIYVVTGDGPDVAGVGSFSLSRLPFNVGCINWRSVIATDEGVFFQSERGLMMLPRGFAEPIHVEQVVETLAQYPYITSVRTVRTLHKEVDGFGPPERFVTAERTVQWACCIDSTSNPEAGRIIVYDTTRRTWGVDSIGGSPAVFVTQWERTRAHAAAAVSGLTHPISQQSDAYSDAGTAIEMVVRTGDLRPWGTFAHGVINRVGVMGELRSACDLDARLTTENGFRIVERTYTGIAPDPVTEDTVYLEAALGKDTQRDVNFLRVELSESSTDEGIALFGMVVEHDTKPQGFRLLGPQDRKT